MQKKPQQSLEALAERDPVSRPLALLQLETLRTAADPIWSELADADAIPPPSDDVPALHNQSISVDARLISQLLQRLAAILSSSDTAPAPNGLTSLSRLDPLKLLQAAIESDDEAFLQMADEFEVDLQILAIIGQCSALPPLLALGHRAMQQNADLAWEPGYCPICGSWPLLAEQRGLEKQQWLRCGRCTAAWRTRHQRCIFCENTDHTRLGYMAAENERESRRVTTCRLCKSYFKIFATVTPLPIAELLRYDLESVELDVAAIDEGYSRPDRPGYPLQVTITPAERSRGGWFPWR